MPNKNNEWTVEGKHGQKNKDLKKDAAEHMKNAKCKGESHKEVHEELKRAVEDKIVLNHHMGNVHPEVKKVLSSKNIKNVKEMLESQEGLHKELSKKASSIKNILLLLAGEFL